MAFISQTAFAKKAEQQKEAKRALSWKDLPVNGEIYKIEVIEEKVGKYGPCYIANTINERGEKKRIWIPIKLVRDIEGKEDKKIYFISLGQEERDGKTFNNYDLVIE